MRTGNLLIILCIILVSGILYCSENNVIELNWDNVTDFARYDNLSLQMSEYDYKTAKADEMKAWGGFLPSIDYQWVWSDDELTQLQVPMDNMFMHSLSLTYPLFTGGARYANLKMQQHLKKSIAAELKGAEASVVLQSLQAYYGVTLSKSLVGVYQEANVLAERNLHQLESMLEAGTTTDLAVMQARTRYLESIPQLESARNQQKLAENQLKMLLNIAAEDSIVVNEQLAKHNFLGSYAKSDLTAIKTMAKNNRSEVIQIENQNKAVKQQKLLACSQFMPQVALTAGRSFYAYSNDFWINKDEFQAYNSVGMAVQMPLFSGGSRWYDVKQAGYAQKKMSLAVELTIDQVELEAEQAYYSYLEARENLTSQQEAFKTAEESLRLANLYFEEGMTTQTEVLGAQLSYTQNQVALTQVIYNYNTSQLALLQSIGELANIWKK